MVEFPEFAHLLDVPVAVEATLEGPTLKVSALLALAVGSFITTQHAAGENVAITAGDAPVGAGELSIENGQAVVRMVQFRGQN